MLRSEQDHKLVAGAADIACTNGEDGIAGARFAQQMFDAFVHRLNVEDVLMAGFANGVSEGLAGHAGDGLLAGGVDVGQDEDVGLIEGTAEIVPEMLGARIAMRLE